MSTESFHRPLLLLLLCVTLLGTRIGGMHLHLCFDGQEPPASLHMLDLDVQHEAPGIDAPHQDADLVLGENGLVKFVKSMVELPVLLLALLLVWRAPAVRLHRPRRTLDVPAPLSSFSLRPPSCGPPVLFSR